MRSLKCWWWGWRRVRGAWDTSTGGHWWAEVMGTRMMGAPGQTQGSRGTATRGLGQGPGPWDALGSFFAFKKIIDLCNIHMGNKQTQTVTEVIQ